MIRGIVLLLLLGPVVAFGGEPVWRGPWKGVPELVPLLESVPRGKRLLERARAKDPAFLARIHAGDASFTESTLARTYSLLDGKERREVRHEVILNRAHSLNNAVLDLAHELVHFTEKNVMDPYVPAFERIAFIRAGIEGEGGELPALEQECLVAWELEKRFARFPRHTLCEPYRSADGSFDKESARKDYYAVGPWKDRLEASVQSSIPEIMNRPVIFSSSYARKPYPLALSEEFDATRKAACENNRKKHRLISAQSDRAPSSESLQRERVRLKTYERLYCSSSDHP